VNRELGRTPVEQAVVELRRLIEDATARGNLSLGRYVELIDGFSESRGLDKAVLHEAVRASLGDAYVVEVVGPEP
jgi:hypothetical protein